MRTSQGIRLLLENVSRPGVRAGSFAARKKDVFNASKLVLDLEAADNKYVRKFEEDPNNDISASPKKFDKVRRARFNQSTKSEDVATRTALDIFQATAPDYLSYILLGNPFSVGPYSGNGLYQVFQSHGLTLQHRSFSDNIKWLRDNALSGHRVQTNQFISKLRGCSNVNELRRTISFVARARNGCEFLASNGQVIVDAIERYDPILRLETINALIQLLESKGLDPGPIIIEAAFYSAAVGALLLPLKHYIEMVISKQYPLGEKLGDAILQLAKSVVDGRTGGRVKVDSPNEASDDTAERCNREDALRLMTGWEADGVPKEGEKRKPSFAIMASNEKLLYRFYIEGIAILGANEALSFESRNKVS